MNRLREPTAIHWHGIELDSYYDGVPGWSGLGTQITSRIEPGASFVARMRPPRAGTFIYHTHWHDPSQLTNGVYGPLIVLPKGQQFDASSDLTFVFGIGDFGALRELALINGTPQSKTLQLQTGRTYRFRLINISTNNQGMQVSLRDANGPVEWLNIAKDGIDLPPHRNKAQLTITVGETYDVEFSTTIPQDLLLDLCRPRKFTRPKLLRSCPLLQIVSNTASLWSCCPVSGCESVGTYPTERDAVQCLTVVPFCVNFSSHSITIVCKAMR